MSKVVTNPAYYLSSSTTVNAPGTGYTAGDILTLVGGVFTTAAQITVVSISATGVVTFNVTTPGVYSAVPTNPVTTSGGTGTGCRLTAFWGQNDPGYTTIQMYGTNTAGTLPPAGTLNNLELFVDTATPQLYVGDANGNPVVLNTGGGGGGSVMSVAASVPAGFKAAVSNPTSTPSVNITYDPLVTIPVTSLGGGAVPPSATTYLAGNGNWTVFPTLPTGTVTSVALALPSPFSLVGGSPVTTAGTITYGWGSGQIPAANLGTNTPLASTFLNGLNQWVSPSVATLTFGTGLTGSSYNGSTAVTTAIDTTIVTTLTGTQVLTNKTLTTPTINGGVVRLLNEATSAVSASAGIVTIDASAASIFNTTLSGTTSLTINNLSTSLSVVGQAITLAVLSTQTAATAFINAVSVTGASSVNLLWQGGAPVSGGASGRDLYQISILLTGAGTYTVLVSRSNFT